MIDVRIDVNGKTGMKLNITGSPVVCAKESSIMLIEICKALSAATGNTFDEVFGAIVQGAKLLQFFRDKEEKNEH